MLGGPSTYFERSARAPARAENVIFHKGNAHQGGDPPGPPSAASPPSMCTFLPVISGVLRWCRGWRRPDHCQYPAILIPPFTIRITPKAEHRVPAQLIHSPHIT